MSRPGSDAASARLRRGAEERLRLSPPADQAETDCRRLVHELQVHRIELEMQNEELRDAHAAVARASQAKSRFLANTSHELRLPLTQLLLSAQLLADDLERKLSDQQLEYARSIVAAGGDLLRLVDDFQDLAGIEAGRLTVEPRWVLFPDLLRDVGCVYREMAARKGLEFAVGIDADVPPAMVTDPQRLHQVLNNLIGNAVKFTRAGRIGLRVRLAVPGTPYAAPRLRQAAAVVAFDVADTGVGIAASRQAGIFAGTEDGSGLGLAIVRQLTELLGGELALASAPGQGSTFTIYLPLGAGRAAEPEA